MRVAVKVFVVAMSAPAAKYESWISVTISGLREVEEVGVALDVARVLAEALAAVLLLGELPPVDEHAPRPVEDEDPLGEQLLDLCGRPSRIGSRLESREPGRPAGSLGVW